MCQCNAYQHNTTGASLTFPSFDNILLIKDVIMIYLLNLSKMDMMERHHIDRYISLVSNRFKRYVINVKKCVQVYRPVSGGSRRIGAYW